MKSLFRPNLDRQGRLFRALMGLALLAAAAFGFKEPVWLSPPLAVGGFFGRFETLRGWCLARACGLNTRF